MSAARQVLVEELENETLKLRDERDRVERDLRVMQTLFIREAQKRGLDWKEIGKRLDISDHGVRKFYTRHQYEVGPKQIRDIEKRYGVVT